MLNDFSTEYAELSDEELLQVASDRASLTDGAVVALDAEMRKRHLTHIDITKHESFVKRSTQREAKRRARKLLGSSSRDRESWVDRLVTAFWSVLAIALISITYTALPQQYHFSPDWQEAATYVMFVSVFIAVASSFWWRRIAFWISLLISSAVHAILVHMWVVRVGTLSGRGHRADARLAILLGAVIFAVVYGCSFLLHRKFYGKDIAEQ